MAAHSSALHRKGYQRCFLIMSRLNPWPRLENPPKPQNVQIGKWGQSQKALVMWSSHDTQKGGKGEADLMPVNVGHEIHFISLPLNIKYTQWAWKWKQHLTITGTELWLSHAVLKEYPAVFQWGWHSPMDATLQNNSAIIATAVDFSQKNKNNRVEKRGRCLNSSLCPERTLEWYL